MRRKFKRGGNVAPVRKDQAKLSAPAASLKQQNKRVLPHKTKAVSTTRQDIQSWKRALSLAQSETPKTWQLQRLYDEILNDALLTSQINNRKQQVVSMGFSLKKPNGEVDVEQTKLLKKHPLYRFLTKASLDDIYYGYELVELNYKPDINKKPILMGESLPRTNVVPQMGLFYPDYTEDKPIKYRELPEYGIWILEYNSGGLGLLNKAVPHVLFKRFAQSCWAELCEIYGIPPRVMKTNTQDATMLARAEQMMSDIGAAAWFIIDEAEEFEFAQGVATKGEVYDNLINLCGNEMSMLISGAIIGQDTKHGNRSKDEAGQEVLWYLVQDDMALCEERWNNTNIPALVRHGILKGDLTFEFDEAEDIGQLWSMVKEALQHYIIDPAWIKDKFGIDVTAKEEPKEKEDAKKLKAILAFLEEAKDSNSDAFKLLAGFFLTAPATTTGAAMKSLAKTCCSGTHILLALPDQFDIDGYLQRIYSAEGQLIFDTSLFTYTANTLAQGLKKGWNDKNGGKLSNIGYVYGMDDPAVLTAYEMNLFRFAAGKTLAEAKKLNDLFKKSSSFNEFYLAAKQVTEIFNKEYLQTEYTTAMLTGESAATYARLMAQSETFPYWEYKTVGDDKVRTEHQALHGLILPYNDPIWKKLFPPNGWNCRCYVVARMKHEVKDIDFDTMRARAESYFETAEFKTAKAQGWGVNRAESGEVFTANQQYINKLPGKASKSLEKIGAPDYKLPSYSNAKKVATEEMPKYEDSIEKFLKGLDKLDDIPVLRDYNNRPISIDKEVMKGIDASQRSRLAAMQQTVKSPNEVWINNYQGDAFEDMISIKYYKDQTLIVVTRIQNGKVIKLNTWFPLEETKNIINKFRRGLLVKSK